MWDGKPGLPYRVYSFLSGDLIASKKRTIPQTPEQSERSDRRLLLGSSIALTLSTGAAAFLVKRSADTAYEEYLRLANPVKQEQHFRKAVRHDRIAGGLWIALEVGVLVTWYLAFS